VIKKLNFQPDNKNIYIFKCGIVKFIIKLGLNRYKGQANIPGDWAMYGVGARSKRAHAL
jgi:hypothetical protein